MLRSSGLAVLWLVGLCLALTALASLAAAEVSAPAQGPGASPTRTPAPRAPLTLASQASAPTSTPASVLKLIFPLVANLPSPTPTATSTATPVPTKTPTVTPTPTPDACQQIPGVSYTSLTINGAPTDRPAAIHADLNLSMRSYEATSGYRGLVYYGGNPDLNAPQFPTLFADYRTPTFTNLYRVYDWNWSCNCRGGLIGDPAVTLLGLGTTPGEIVRVPRSGYNIGQGYQVLVLYASPDRITLKYTREDNVVWGYALHVEGICVEPSLLSLYRSLNDAGRGRLPALTADQPFGRARGREIGVAIRDCGSFMDPRSGRDWWQGR